MATQQPTGDAQLSDAQLIALVLIGEQEKFTELMRRYERALLRVAHSRLGRRDWAEDVVQDTFLNALKWLHTYDSRYSFRTWLWTILLNQCHRCWKKQSRGVFIGIWRDVESSGDLRAELAKQLQSDETPSEAAVARERTQLLDGLLRRLPESQADALRLRFFGSLTYPEIAAAMGCSQSTAKNRVKCGLIKLAEWLGPQGQFAGYDLSETETSYEGGA